jgi:secreted trypsin-like serine protease
LFALRKLAAAGAAVTVTALGGAAYAGTDQTHPTPASHAAATPTPVTGSAPFLIGGHAPSQPYPGIASLQLDHNGDPNWHACTVAQVFGYWVVVNAHCVTRADGTATDPATWHLRVGSADRTTGGVLAHVTAVLPHADWDWATGTDPVADIALLRLDRYLQGPAFEIGTRTTGGGVTRLLGWGVTEPSGQGPVPTGLRELDSTLLPAGRCAAAGITAGEICIANPHGTDGVCYGDSGGPALQQHTGRWQLVGGASRFPGHTCGATPTVFTDLTHYRGWIYQVARTGTVPPATSSNSNTGTAPKPGQTPAVPPPPNLTWTGTPAS